MLLYFGLFSITAKRTDDRTEFIHWRKAGTRWTLVQVHTYHAEDRCNCVCNSIRFRYQLPRRNNLLEWKDLKIVRHHN